MQVATLWILVGIGIELILVSLIAYTFLIWKKERLTQPWKKDVNLLENQISQADALTARIFRELGSRFVEFKDLFQKLELKEARIGELLFRADSAFAGIGPSPGKNGKNPVSNRYRDVILLSKEGYSRDEISERTGIGGKEMDLVLRLSRKEKRKVEQGNNCINNG